MGIIRAEDIVKHDGDVKAALDEKRDDAARHLEATGGFPDWWELGITLGNARYKSKRGPAPKFADPDAMYSQGYEYFMKCAERDVLPTRTGLVLALGFPAMNQLYAYARRNIEFRDVVAILLEMLKLPLEMEIAKPGGQAGKMFLLKNIPEGLSPEDDANTPMRYGWHDKHQTELTGASGGPVLIDRKMSPEEAYLKMLEGGRLAPREDEDEDSSNDG